MMREIRKVAVLGAGTMGSRIAAHFANAGIDCLLLDVPVTNASGLARNGIAEQALKKLQKERIPPFFSLENANKIEVGNFADDLDRLGGVDWILEAVTEDFEIKRSLLTKVDKNRCKGSLVTTNTSGLPVGKLAEGLSKDFRKHWLGTHFFNPPRQMRLLEIIETDDTEPEIVDFVNHFCDERLGKIVIPAKDQPNFIANRLFLFSVMQTIKTMLAQGLTVDEVDMLTGPLIGRSRMATFRLADLAGVDVCLLIASNLHPLVPDDEQRDVYIAPEFLSNMVSKNLIGDKAGAGFYRKDQRAPGGRLVLDLNSLEYREVRRPDWPVLENAKAISDTGERVKFLVQSDDPAGMFLRETLTSLLIYTAARIPEISDSISDVDATMTSGFNWDLGPFELWDALGVKNVAKWAADGGMELPPLVRAVLESSNKSFHIQKSTTKMSFDFLSGTHQVVEDKPATIRVASVRRQGNVRYSNASASLLDLGDGVICLEFHSKANSLDEAVFEIIAKSVEEVEKGYEALVIGNEGDYFSAGANLAMLLALSREKNWAKIEQTVEKVQQLFLSLRACSKPTVAAVFSRTLAGGCELAMHCDRVQAAAETYMGLVEVGAGLIPAGGGCKELVRRSTEIFSIEDPIVHPVKSVFETIGVARVTGSAIEAKHHKLLRASDSITMNQDRLLADAKQAALDLVTTSYRPQSPPEILVGGRGVRAALEMGPYLMREAERISDYDYQIGKKLAHVIAGGNLSQPSFVSEDYMLGLEREAFVSLCGEEKTQQRMETILKTGKPLRN